MTDSARTIRDLTALLYDPDKSVRNAAALELGSRGREGFHAVIPLLDDVSWVVRHRACEVVGMTKCAEAYPVLVRMLEDARDHVRYMAVKGLGNLGNRDALPAVLAMQKDANPFVQRIATTAAAQLSR